MRGTQWIWGQFIIGPLWWLRCGHLSPKLMFKYFKETFVNLRVITEIDVKGARDSCHLVVGQTAKALNFCPRWFVCHFIDESAINCARKSNKIEKGGKDSLLYWMLVLLLVSCDDVKRCDHRIDGVLLDKRRRVRCASLDGWLVGYKSKDSSLSIRVIFHRLLITVMSLIILPRHCWLYGSADKQSILWAEDMKGIKLILYPWSLQRAPLRQAGGNKNMLNGWTESFHGLIIFIPEWISAVDYAESI